ncbi:SH3 domain-containing protein [Streptomyces sp. SID8352]|uniref:SH3 domain-containing protein n=1 Tax=Streptomyces sp. SID8352 TaxID=2690338 RepID=UPI00136BF8D7|nr:SH3 domain-containing protein [Streptomyces sp. SID8352]MYU24357.1 SH3 domain-containing protein [Streptomyces sp. SID8352]
MPTPQPRPVLVRRFAIAAATGALLASVAAAPAGAADGPDPGPSAAAGQNAHGERPGGGSGAGGDGGGGNGSGGNGGGGVGHQGNVAGSGGTGGNGTGRPEQSGAYRGVVTADRLALRTSPTRGGDVIRYAHRGEIVSIHCKTPGDTVRGNPLWYLLTDGTWAWGAARYIDNIGPAPRWC